jgi:hypothetical protein
MRKLITNTLIAVALALGVAAAQPTAAHAVTYGYCYDSLRGGGSLAPDNDIAIKVRQFNDQGKNVIGTSHLAWHYASGSYLVEETVMFNFGNGTSVSRRFNCYGSGGGYHDGWTGE